MAQVYKNLKLVYKNLKLSLGVMDIVHGIVQVYKNLKL